MTEPVSPLSGAYPSPAIIARRDDVRPVAVRPVATPVPQGTASPAAAPLPGIVLAGAGWVPVLQGYPRRGLRADEAERRRYRANYAGSTATPAQPARLERRA